MQNKIPVECDPIKQMYFKWHPKTSVENFLSSEAYAVMFVWNELYQLPYKNFLVKFLQRLGVNEKDFAIQNIEFEQKLHLNKTPLVRPDVLIKSDKNVIAFEFKNFYKGDSKFQNEQIPREYFAALKEAKGNPAYLVLVANENLVCVDEKSVEITSVKVNGRGNKRFYQEVKDYSELFLKREKSLRPHFKKHFGKDKIIVLSWRKFLRELYVQLGSSKKNARNKDLEEIYSRVGKRIECFVSARQCLNRTA